MNLAEEPYLSIQGEGVMTGIPCVFVRVQGCSVHCAWCDTSYTWKFRKHLQREPKDVVSNVRALDATTIILTGGEPLEQDLHELQNLVILAAEVGVITHVETSGLGLCDDIQVEGLTPKFEFLNLCAFNTISWKPGIDKTFDWTRVMQIGNALKAGSFQYKFVVDIDNIQDIVRKVAGYIDPSVQVVIQPDTSKVKSNEELGDLGEEFINLYREKHLYWRKIRFMDRLHYRMWGNEKLR